MAFLIAQTCGQIYNSREAALRYTIPSLQTSYLIKALLESCSVVALTEVVALHGIVDGAAWRK